MRDEVVRRVAAEDRLLVGAQPAQAAGQHGDGDERDEGQRDGRQRDEPRGGGQVVHVSA